MTFEEWYAGYNPANKSDKERAKDAWEAAAKGLDHSGVPDARLAAAAPEMLDALRVCLKALRHEVYHSDLIVMQADDAASAAIAKATGGVA